MKSMKTFGRILLIAGILSTIFFVSGIVVFAETTPTPETPVTTSATETPVVTSAEAAASNSGFAAGMAYIGAALSTGIAAIGGGIAVGAGAPAAIGALTEDPKSFGKALIFVALGEGIALYGMLIAILILNKV